MPYTKDNPPDKIKGLPEHAREIWISAYNSAIKEYEGDEEKANATAWSAVKKAGYDKDKEGKWVKMSEDEPNFDEVEIWEAGDYPQGSFSETDLDEIVRNFDPNYHEPPAVIDHKEEGPAYGWVEKIWRNGSKLMAKFKEVSNELKNWVKEGKFKKRSIALWDNFEGTGKLVLKHVSWLGAIPPQVKGLRNQFSILEDAHGRVLYMNLEDKNKKPKKGEIDMTNEEFDKMFAEKMKPFEDKVATLTKANEDLVKANEELKKNQAVKFSEEAKRKKQERIDVVVTGLLKEGKITPAYVDAGFKQFLMAQPDTAVLTFGEGNEKKEIPVIDFAIDFFSNKIKGAPVIFKEVSKENPNTPVPSTPGTQFKVISPKEQITADSLDLHERTLKFMNEFNSKNLQYPINYKKALLEVSRTQA